MQIMNNEKNGKTVNTQLFGNKELTLLFGGDICLKSNVNFSKEIIDLFKSADYSILNLEAPILLSGLVFKKYPRCGPHSFQDEKVVEVLKQLQVKYVSGGNNHIMDFGIEGMKSTIQALNKNNIFFGGFGNSLEQARIPLVLGDTNIAILCVAEEEFGAASKLRPGYYSMYLKEVLEQIKEIKKRDKLVIVFAHGGSEEIPLPSKYILDRYRQFIDSGADLVVGHHPHVPQGYEKHNGKFIFYSVGNFIHFSFSKSTGILLKIVISGLKIKKFEIIPVQVVGTFVNIHKDELVYRYINLCNNVLRNPSMFDYVYQQQAMYMYNQYYFSYLKNIFSLKSSIKHLIKYLIKKRLYCLSNMTRQCY